MESLNWRSERNVVKQCMTCGCDFLTTVSQKTRAKYCSNRCKKRLYSFRFDYTCLHRMRSSVRQCVQRLVLGNMITPTRGALRHMNYTSRDLAMHVKNQLQSGCCICHKTIEGDFDIAHLIPASSAQTLEELVRLFTLSNLSVAHVTCNRALGAEVV